MLALVRLGMVVLSSQSLQAVFQANPPRSKGFAKIFKKPSEDFIVNVWIPSAIYLLKISMSTLDLYPNAIKST